MYNTFHTIGKQSITWKFQSTHSRRVRLKQGSIEHRDENVSIHALTKSATSLIQVFTSSMMFQSTHSRRVRRRSGFKLAFPYNSFNPRTHEECDFVFDRKKVATKEFQSTHSRRVRLSLQICHHSNQPVSIHALTK